MYDTFLYIPKDWFGGGWLLAAWAVGSVLMLGWLVWRQGFNADTAGHLPLLAVLGAVIYWVLPRLCDSKGLPIHGYGVMLLTAVLSSAWLATRRARSVGLHPDVIYTLVIWMFVPGIIGARLFYVIEYWQDFQQPTLRATLAGLFSISTGGLVFYGSAIGGLLGLMACARRYRLPMLAVSDLLAPSMMLGLAVGRIGCLLHGCCFGGLCDLPWAVQFPRDTPPYESQVSRGQMYGFELRADAQGRPVIRRVRPGTPAVQQGLRAGDVVAAINEHPVADAAEAHKILLKAFPDREPLTIDTADHRHVELPEVAPPPRSLPVHPSQAYASINGFLLCGLLLALAPFRRRDGELTALMMLLYPVTRFLEEIIRNDEGAVLGTGMTISQNVSILLLTVGVLIWLYTRTRPRGVALWR